MSLNFDSINSPYPICNHTASYSHRSCSSYNRSSTRWRCSCQFPSLCHSSRCKTLHAAAKPQSVTVTALLSTCIGNTTLFLVGKVTMTLPSALWPSWIKPCKQLRSAQHAEILSIYLFLAQQPSVSHGLLIHEVSRSHTTTHHSRQDSSGRVISSSRGVTY
jgi:hypothetical protein